MLRINYSKIDDKAFAEKYHMASKGAYMVALGLNGNVQIEISKCFGIVNVLVRDTVEGYIFMDDLDVLGAMIENGDVVKGDQK